MLEEILKEIHEEKIEKYWRIVQFSEKFLVPYLRKTLLKSLMYCTEESLEKILILEILEILKKCLQAGIFKEIPKGTVRKLPRWTLKQLSGRTLYEILWEVLGETARCY